MSMTPEQRRFIDYATVEPLRSLAFELCGADALEQRHLQE